MLDHAEWKVQAQGELLTAHAADSPWHPPVATKDIVVFVADENRNTSHIVAQKPLMRQHVLPVGLNRSIPGAWLKPRQQTQAYLCFKQVLET